VIPEMLTDLVARPLISREILTRPGQIWHVSVRASPNSPKTHLVLIAIRPHGIVKLASEVATGFAQRIGTVGSDTN